MESECGLSVGLSACTCSCENRSPCHRGRCPWTWHPASRRPPAAVAHRRPGPRSQIPLPPASACLTRSIECWILRRAAASATAASGAAAACSQAGTGAVSCRVVTDVLRIEDAAASCTPVLCCRRSWVCCGDAAPQGACLQLIRGGKCCPSTCSCLILGLTRQCAHAKSAGWTGRSGVCKFRQWLIGLPADCASWRLNFRGSC